MGRQRELLRLSIILCMGLLFVMAGILLIVGKPAVKRPASIAVGVLMIAWGFLCGIPESRSWMLVYILALWLMGAIVIMMGGRR